MKYTLLFSCIFVLCLANIVPDLGLEESGKEIEDFSPKTVDELANNISDEDDDYDEEDDFEKTRIAGGRKAKRYSIPYHAALTLTKTTPPEVKPCCGVLVSPTRVLTTNNCVRGFNTVKVELGVRNFFNEGEHGRVTYIVQNTAANILIHRFHNFALIKLPEAVPLSHRIQPARLPVAPNTVSYVGYFMKIAGFGAYRSHKAARKIRFTEGFIVPKNECAESGSNYICFSGRKGGAACNGDEGCAITSKFRDQGETLVALVDEVVTDCSGTHPKGNTIGIRVVDALDFIRRNS